MAGLLSKADGFGTMDDETERLRTIADYQFGTGAGQSLFPAGDLMIRRSKTGRPEQVFADGERLVSYRTDGRFTLGVAGGKRLLDGLASPTARVAVGTESDPFVREGKNAFAKFVRTVDLDVRPGDEVCIVGPDDELLGVGRAKLSAAAMTDFETGVAVKTRDGADS